MKFSPCEWTWRNLKGWSPQRIAAARRAVDKEAAKVAAKRDEVALFPELQAEIEPAFTTVEERQAMMDAREVHITRHFRGNAARTWRAARRCFYRLPEIRRRGVRRLWNESSTPKGPAFFAEFVRSYSQPGASPWTYLRKLRLIWLWNFGGWSKPAHFREVTANFNTLGPIPHLRLRTQNMITVARLSGTSLRVVRERIERGAA